MEHILFLVLLFVSLGLLKHAKGYVMKPVQNDNRGRIEIDFYENVFHSPTNEVTSKLQNLIPKFLGLHEFANNSTGLTHICVHILL